MLNRILEEDTLSWTSEAEGVGAAAGFQRMTVEMEMAPRKKPQSQRKEYTRKLIKREINNQSF